jgi:membrane protein
MGAFDRPLRAADQFQRRRPALAFAVAVWVKFREDQAGDLGALISYYAFAAIFPLLLVLASVLNIVLRNDPSLRGGVLDSALSEYPVIGPQIRASLGSLPGSGVLPLVIGAVLLLFGARGVSRAMQNAMCEIWGIRRPDRPGFPASQLWGLALVLTIGLGFIVTTSLSGLANGVGHLVIGAGGEVGALLVSLALNFGVFWLSFRIATGLQVPWRNLRTGAAAAAVCWQLLQAAGGYVVSHQLHRASELYGTFGIVLGLLTWLFLQAEVTLLAAEADVVLARRLWPRRISPAPGGEQDRDAAVLAGDGPGQPETPEVPAPREHTEDGGHAYQREAYRWFSRARRARENQQALAAAARRQEAGQPDDG